jgi:8-oxo-dGTP pyrophosphatase MutT (NUDIX family)
MKCPSGYAAAILEEVCVNLSSKLDDYAAAATGEESIIAQFRELLAEPACFLRSNLDSHFTGAAWLVSGDGQRALLTHHRKLNRWLQLGGHADGDTDLMRVALREAEEESGLPDLEIESDIFDLDRHWIPERKDVPGHWHYDVRFVVHARGSDEFVVSEESHALAWREIAGIAVDADVDPSIRRMALRWRERQRREL